MAEALAALVPYIATDLPDIPPDQLVDMEAEDNGAILYIVKAQGNGTIRRPNGAKDPWVADDVSSSSEVGNHPTETPKGEAEKTNYLALSLLLTAAVMITFRNRIISMITSYTRKDGQIYLPPPPSSSIVK